jgi:hypothetical protein
VFSGRVWSAGRQFHQWWYKACALIFNSSKSYTRLIHRWEFNILVWKSVSLIACNHVDGLRPCLWTAATNGPIVRPPRDIWAWRTVVEWSRQRKTPDSSARALWQSYQQSSSIKPKERAKWIMNLALHNFFVRTCKWFLHAVKSYDMRPPDLLPPPPGFLSPLRIYHLSLVWTRDPLIQWQAR